VADEREPAMNWLVRSVWKMLEKVYVKRISVMDRTEI
jgi:hypothetical protein